MKIRHHHPGSAYGLLLTLLLLLVTAGSGGLGCDETKAALDVPPVQALRLRFPEQAAAVLAPDEALRSTPQGFSLEAPTRAAPHRALELTLPRDGQGVLRLRNREGFEVRVRELGVEGEGSLAERAVAYRRADGTSFWTAAPEGG